MADRLFNDIGAEVIIWKEAGTFRDSEGCVLDPKGTELGRGKTQQFISAGMVYEAAVASALKVQHRGHKGSAARSHEHQVSKEKKQQQQAGCSILWAVRRIYPASSISGKK
uniref:Uncharacterized protein n=1 Tax=Oryza brachyantha TaxID=4533 RepID=J3MQU4_ORYBR